MESKFFALILLAAMVAAAAGASIADDKDFHEDMTQLALFEKDDVEVAYLREDRKIFADYCLTSRDDVKSYMKNNMNEAAQKVFNIMFNSIEDLELEYDMSDADEDDIEQGVEILKASGVGDDQAKVATSSAEIDRNIEDNVDKVRKTSLWSTVTESVRLVINTIIETVMSETTRRLAIFKAQFKGENLRDVIKQSCMDISFRLKLELEQKLADNKKVILKADLSPEMEAAVTRTKFENVGCVTTSRIHKVTQFCDTLNAVGPVIFRMFDM